MQYVAFFLLFLLFSGSLPGALLTTALFAWWNKFR